jgi:hypothetical protein
MFKNKHYFSFLLENVEIDFTYFKKLSLSKLPINHWEIFIVTLNLSFLIITLLIRF